MERDLSSNVIYFLLYATWFDHHYSIQLLISVSFFWRCVLYLTCFWIKSPLLHITKMKIYYRKNFVKKSPWSERNFQRKLLIRCYFYNIVVHQNVRLHLCNHSHHFILKILILLSLEILSYATLFEWWMVVKSVIYQTDSIVLYTKKKIITNFQRNIMKWN